MRASFILRERLTKYVSLRYAPSFRQPDPKEVIGIPARKIPKDCVPAFIIPDVVTSEEEQALLDFTEPWFSRLSYNSGHVDALIHHYKEFYRSYAELMGESAHPTVCKESCDERNITQGHFEEGTLRIVRTVLDRCRGLASNYLPNIPLDDRVHFLRLSRDGFIRAHVDESRNSSGIIAGLTLASGRVMTLTHPMHPGERVELLLAPRSFYIMIGTARYEWEHSTDWIMDDEEHIRRIQKIQVDENAPLIFDGKETPLRRGERTAMIFRGVSPMELLLSRLHKKSVAG